MDSSASSWVPVEVLGVIAHFAVVGARAALLLGFVSRRWALAIADADDMWAGLLVRKWPRYWAHIAFARQICRRCDDSSFEWFRRVARAAQTRLCWRSDHMTLVYWADRGEEHPRCPRCPVWAEELAFTAKPCAALGEKPTAACAFCGNAVAFVEAPAPHITTAGELFPGASVVAALVASGTSVACVRAPPVDECGATFLHNWVTVAGGSLCQRLVNVLRVDVNAHDQNQWTALHKLAGSRRHGGDALAACEWLVCKGGADVNARDGLGATPLHHAVSDVALCAVLIAKCGADANARDASLQTPLHWAALRKCADTCAWLLSNGGVDINARDNQRRTALSVAEKTHGGEAVAALLRDAGGVD